MTAAGLVFRFQFTLSLLFSFLLTIQPVAAFGADIAANSSAETRVPAVDQRAIQVLSRLTFGARPGDLENVKKMGVTAFINAQLSPDVIDDSALQKRLDKLPTLMLSN